MGRATAAIVVLDPDAREGRRIAEWLRVAGLGTVSAVRTCDEAIFILGRRRASLLIIDEQVTEHAEERLLNHIAAGQQRPPALVRLIARDADPLAVGRAMACEVVRKPLDVHDVVVRVGTALERPDLLGHLDRQRDQSLEHLASARRMQLGLLPTDSELARLQDACGVGIASMCRSGDAVGGDFWGVWPTGRRRLAVSLADFAGHGLSAALNTFRLHAILSDQSLPRGAPTRMSGLLNQRLHALLPRGHYATMVYAQIDPATHRVAWCSAGGPPPMFVSTEGSEDLEACGLPLGVKRDVAYRRNGARLAGPGVLCLFSDGLTESGGGAPDVPREAIAAVLAQPALLASVGRLAQAAQIGVERLQRLRDEYSCPGHSDDVMAVCIAIGERTEPGGVGDVAGVGAEPGGRTVSETEKPPIAS